MLKITLPYPPADLNPNARQHHMALARAKKAYKILCMQECMAQGVQRLSADMADVFIEYFPPDNRRRDDDNAISSFKAGRDGVAARIGIDDADWQTTHRVHKGRSDKHPKGAVVLHISPLKVLEIRGAVS